jgi:CheY-like chemotaxis protein
MLGEFWAAEKTHSTENVKAVITKGRIDRQVHFNKIQEILRGPVDGRVVEWSSHRGLSKRVLEKVNMDGPLKILVVEDEPDNMFFITEALMPSGYTVCRATDGQEAVETATKEMPDLILMDLRLPVLSGYEARKRIKETEGLKDVPVIALTASAMKRDREKILAAGFDDYIGKPVHPGDLTKKVKQWLGKGSI